MSEIRLVTFTVLLKILFIRLTNSIALIELNVVAKSQKG